MTFAVAVSDSCVQVVVGIVVELALVTHKPRAASAYAVGHTQCAGARCSSTVASRPITA